MEENKPKENRQKKHKLSRKSFLKLLGLSLTSHFLFLNLGKHKAWAAVASGCRCGWSDFGDNPPVHMCTWWGGPDLGCQKNGPPDKCNLSSTPPDPDLCGSKQGISDNCNLVGNDPDQCNTATNEADQCGQAGVSTVDTCNPSAGNTDNCGKQGAYGIIPDFCTQGIDPDSCGQQDESGGYIPDICQPEFYDPDICLPPNEPVKCGGVMPGYPPKSAPDIEEP